MPVSPQTRRARFAQLGIDFDTLAFRDSMVADWLRRSAQPQAAAQRPTPAGPAPRDRPARTTPEKGAQRPAVTIRARASTTTTPGRPVGDSTPLVRRLAAQHGVDLTSVSGSGVGGRITPSDVLSTQAVARAPERLSGRPEPVAQPATSAYAQLADRQGTGPHIAADGTIRAQGSQDAMWGGIARRIADAEQRAEQPASGSIYLQNAQDAMWADIALRVNQIEGTS